MTTKRRKYRYPDRATAEQALRDAEQEGHMARRAIRAMLSGKIEWWSRRVNGCLYRVGLFDLTSPGGPKVLFVTETDQDPAPQVFDAYEWAETVRREADNYLANEEQLAIYEMANTVRDVLRRERLS